MAAPLIFIETYFHLLSQTLHLTTHASLLCCKSLQADLLMMIMVSMLRGHYRDNTPSGTKLDTVPQHHDGIVCGLTILCQRPRGEEGHNTVC